MASLEEIDSLAEALAVIEDLVGALQDLHYKLEILEDLAEYGVLESLLDFVEKTLLRYEMLE